MADILQWVEDYNFDNSFLTNYERPYAQFYPNDDFSMKVRYDAETLTWTMVSVEQNTDFRLINRSKI